MAEGILENVLERIAAAAAREGELDHHVAREILVRGRTEPGETTAKLRAATIEAIAIKALDPKQNTEPMFRKALANYLEDPQSPDQETPRVFDQIVGEAVRAVVEERLLGKKSPEQSGLSRG